jgi:hypothetical protein
MMVSSIPPVGASLRDRALVLRIKPIFVVLTLRASIDLRTATTHLGVPFIPTMAAVASSGVDQMSQALGHQTISPLTMVK